MMNETARIEAEQHAAACYPRESCGLLVQVGDDVKYWPCQNVAKEHSEFEMHAGDYAAADSAGEILAVVHSHPNISPEPSQADMVYCEKTGLPWFIVSWPSSVWFRLDPTGYKAPLIGRQFSHGVLDCYTLVRDWYAEHGVNLPDFERQDNWWLNGGDLYRQNYAAAGFRKVSDGNLKFGDLLVMQVASPVPNHGAIYLGDNMILHHLSNRLSCRDVYGGYFQNNTVLVLRHDSFTKSHSGG